MYMSITNENLRTVSYGTQWRRIQELPLYEVSDNGKVRNAITQQMICPFVRNSALYVRLYDREKHTSRVRAVDKLVLEAFRGKPDYSYRVIHGDRNLKNNDYRNLYSVRDRRRYFKGKIVREFDLSGQLIRTWRSGAEAANHYGIKPSAIYRCCAGKKMTVLYKVWRWYDDSFDKYKTPVPELADPDEHFIRITGTFAEVSNHGRIRDTRREGKYYNRRKNGTIRIMTNGEVLQKRGYQLVAEAFLPNPHGHKWIKFIDGDRTNWRADNLMWSNDYYGK